MEEGFRSRVESDAAHPIFLCIKSHIVQLLVHGVYVTSLYAGPSTIMSVIAQSYHIPSLKRYLKVLSRRCTSCQRTFARTAQQQMGELPADRTRPSKPFSVLGIDFAGPFSYKEGYISVYVCFSTSHVLGQHKWRASWSSNLAFDYWLFIGMLLVCQRHSLRAVLT